MEEEYFDEEDFEDEESAQHRSQRPAKKEGDAMKTLKRAEKSIMDNNTHTTF